MKSIGGRLRRQEEESREISRTDKKDAREISLFCNAEHGIVNL